MRTPDRQLPRDDRELEQMTGIRPADHDYTSTAAITKLEREMLGRDWGKRRQETEEQRQRRLGRPFGC